MGDYATVQKKNNRINVVSENEISVGDVLVGLYGPEGVSSWEVKEVLSVRDSNLPKKKYYELTAEWKNKSPKDYKDKDLSLTSFAFKMYLGKITA